MSRIIPKSIHSGETLARCIVHPLFCSKSKKRLKPAAFLPPPDENEVSILRRNYSPNDSFCKQHCKSLNMGGQTYAGIAIFLEQHILEVNKNRKEGAEKITLLATPLDPDKKIIASDEVVYTTTSGLPMHASIYYETPVQRGKAASRHRATAQLLCRKVLFYLDEDIRSEEWTGPEMVWNAE